MPGIVKLRYILPSIIMGNMFEWFDFSIFGYMAPFISKLFFPEISQSFSIIATFTVFLTGYVARPIGSMFFGYYADKFGRKISLSLSILIMAIATCLIGILPTYSSIGIFACLLLSLLRIIQGFAIGGEFTISIVYLIESAPESKNGLFGSCTMLGTFIGLFLGSVSIAILNIFFTNNQLAEFAWRIPFIFSLVIGLFGLILRIRLTETTEFIALLNKNSTLDNPIKSVISRNYGTLLMAICIVSLGACAFTLCFVWLPTYLKLYSKMNPSYILLMNSSNLLICGVTIKTRLLGSEIASIQVYIVFYPKI